MSKNLMARIVSGGIFTALALCCNLAIHGTPTVRAESNIINEQANPRAGAILITEEENKIKITSDEETINLNEMEHTFGYTTTKLNVRDYPSTVSSNIIDSYNMNDKVEYYKYSNDWGIIIESDEEGIYGYISLEYITDKPYQWDGPKLNRYDGVAFGPSGKETYYNLPMGKVVQYMKDLGYNYEYWVRADGAKMYGEYVMVAANLNKYSKGTIVNTTLGKGIVCDTGDFCKNGSGVDLDVATAWQ